MKLSVVRYSLFPAFVFSSLVVRLDGQELRGTVIQKDNKNALPSVNVLLKDTRFGTTTDSLGQFEIKGFPLGMYILEFRRIGYKTDRFVYTADRPEPTELLVELQVDPIMMHEVIIVDSSKVGRAAHPGTTVFTSEDILRTGTKSLSTFLRARYPGLIPTTPAPGIVRRTYDRLHFVLYLNGTLVQYSSDVLDTMIDVDQVDYIEVYRSFGMTPARDRGSNERVIHIHTKIPELRR
jgi:hypothetical protein